MADPVVAQGVIPTTKPAQMYGWDEANQRPVRIGSTINPHTGHGEFAVFQENHICTDNTTATPLTGGATFTGAWQDCLNYQEVNISVVADQNSATNGLVIEWSADGVVIGDTDTFTIYANSGTNYTPNPAFRYVRVKYTNGAVAQTLFSLQTILRKQMTGGSFHRIDSTLKDDSDGRLVISVPKLRTAQNNYVSQSATNAGNAKVSVEEVEPSSGVASPIVGYVIQELDDATTASVSYIGKVKANGAWLIVKIDETGSFPIWRYANISNNATRTTYALAWANRTTLTYDYMDVVL